MTRETTVLPAQDSAVLDAAEALLRSEQELSLTGELAGRATSVPVPAELRALLADVVRAMRRGQGVTVAPLSQQLTTQQAADLLGISRPTLVKLLEAGQIPFHTPGRHRRVLLQDVLAFGEQRRGRQKTALRELAADAQDLGLYDTAPDELPSALADARRKHA